MNTNARRHGPRPATDMRAPTGARNEAWTSQAIARAQHGDRHAVRYLYSQYASVVRLYLGSLLRDPDLVDDVVQTTFLKVLTKIDRYEAREVPFEAWLIRVARNAAFDELRRRRAGDLRPLLEEDAAIAVGCELPGELWDALDRLPSMWREVLVLRYVLGLPVPEVSSRLGMTPRAVRTLSDRGCASLRGALDRAGSDLCRAGEGRFPRPERPVVVRRLG
jgi:RNA polymerase sigma-70 factor, ECF subfamily